MDRDLGRVHEHFPSRSSMIFSENRLPLFRIMLQCGLQALTPAVHPRSFVSSRIRAAVICSRQLLISIGQIEPPSFCEPTSNAHSRRVQRS